MMEERRLPAEERQFVGENDSLVLDLDDEVYDDWSDAGLPRISMKKSQQRRYRKRIMLCGGIVLLTLLCLGLRQVTTRSKTAKSSSGTNDNDNSQTPQKDQQQHQQETHTTMRPFSLLDPVHDLDLLIADRPVASQPPSAMQPLQVRYPGSALPTNAWYQNMLLVGAGDAAQQQQPTPIHRAYVMPHVVDAAGPVAGLRVLPGRLQVGGSTTEFIVNEQYGVTLGATWDSDSHPPNDLDRRYMVDDASPLAVTLEWGDGLMKSPIVRGMPYGTMIYDKTKLSMVAASSRLLPTIASELPFELMRVDNNHDPIQPNGSTWVEHEMELLVPESDFTWLVFVSERVQVHKSSGSSFQIVSWDNETANTENLVLRIAVSHTCTSGNNPTFCPQANSKYAAKLKEYASLLRKHAHIYPGSKASFSFEVTGDGKNESKLTFDWDAQTVGNPHPLASGDEELLAFALPHHFDMEFATGSPTEDQYCWDSLLGWVCTVIGSNWQLIDTLPPVDFRAPRHPAPWAIKDLANAVVDDLEYRIPDNYRRGAGDTYFSAKMLAKLARIVVIAEEVHEICSNPDALYTDVCSGLTIPSDQRIQAAVDSIRGSLDIWLSQSSEAPFVYDSSWGGVPNCGCYFDGRGCSNKYPNCPAFSDGGLNFGNGFYNDMHFHYGYFIYAASVVARFDPEWGRESYEKILLLVRNIANPSRDDRFFPLLRHVDPYRGHSFASGITLPVFRNGRNQESSSEAIAAYEAVALFGSTMASIFDQPDKKDSAKAVHEVGRIILAMELRSARRYWHVRHEDENDVFKEYQHGVVGILWQTMFQFQTFFGTAPFFIYGIQLLPLTPASEQRDELEWVRSMYSDFAASCINDCVPSGWSIQQLAVLATGGHADEAFDQARALPASVFETSGGNGHSRSNTFWYISTRLPVATPVSLVSVPATVSTPATTPPVISCGRPDSCTRQVLENDAGGYSCEARIRWLMETLKFSEADACNQVAGIEYTVECHGC